MRVASSSSSSFQIARAPLPASTPLPSATARVVDTVRVQLSKLEVKVPLRSIVVSGAGPGGLMAAIAAATDNPGAQITLVEQRSESDPGFHQRPVHLAVKQELLNEIAALSPRAYHALLARSGGPAGLLGTVGVRAGTGETVLLKPGPGVHTDPRAIGSSPEAITASPPVLQVRISDLEQVLFAELKAMRNVKVLTGCDLAFKAGEDGRYALTALRLRKVGNTRVPSGERVELGTPDLVYVAEGVRSTSCTGAKSEDKLGIARTRTTPKGRYMAAHIDESAGRTNYRCPLPNPESKEILRLGAVGHADPAKGTWLLLQVPANASLDGSPEEIKAKNLTLFRTLAAKVLRKTPEEMASILVNDPRPFTLQGDVAEQVTAGQNVLLGGDAAGAAHFAQGVGAVLAGTAHCEAFRDLMRMIKAGLPREEALALYEARIHAAVRAWLEPGLKEFYPNVTGSDQLPSPQMIDAPLEQWLEEKRNSDAAAGDAWDPSRPAVLEKEELAKYRMLASLRREAELRIGRSRAETPAVPVAAAAEKRGTRRWV